jgi:hypothetical protein
MTGNRCILAFMVILTAAAMGLWSGCHREPLPSYLVGAWTSKDSLYEGRILSITPTTVRISLDGKSIGLYRIKNASVVANKSIFRVTLKLVDTKQAVSYMVLHYYPQRDTLQLGNRPETVWHRSSA